MANNPAHVGRRAYAISAVEAGEPVKKVAARLGISRRTLLRWRTGQLKSA